MENDQILCRISGGSFGKRSKVASSCVIVDGWLRKGGESLLVEEGVVNCLDPFVLM